MPWLKRTKFGRTIDLAIPNLCAFLIRMLSIETDDRVLLRHDLYRIRDLLDDIDASGHARMQKEFLRARLLDPDQRFSDMFSQPPQILYKYIPAHRLDYVLPDEKPCSFRATPPNELNDINEVNFRASFPDNERNREEINQEYALSLTELLPTSPVSADDVESYRQKNPHGYGAKLAADQLSKRYGVTAFSTKRNDVKMWSHYADNCSGVVIGYNVDFWVPHLMCSATIILAGRIDSL